MERLFLRLPLAFASCFSVAVALAGCHPASPAAAPPDGGDAALRLDAAPPERDLAAVADGPVASDAGILPDSSLADFGPGPDLAPPVDGAAPDAATDGAPDAVAAGDLADLGGGCTSPASCPGVDGPCSARTCVAGVCGIALAAPGTRAATQNPGSCRVNLCDGMGNAVAQIDDTNVPRTGSACVIGVCTNGTPSTLPAAPGASCSENGGTICNGLGACVQCNTAADCPGSNTDCSTRTCLSSVCGVSYASPGTRATTQVPGDCYVNVCDGAGHVVAQIDDTDTPTPASQCQFGICTDGVPSIVPTPTRSPCTQNGGRFCDGAGSCVQCFVPADCPGADNGCRTRTCGGGVCGANYTASGTPVGAQTPGSCQATVCDGMGAIVTVADDANVPTSSNPCLAGACANGVPSTNPVAPGVACSANGGRFCDGNGSCVQCLAAADCPGQDTACSARTCTAGACGVADAPAGTRTPTQSPGTCQANVCDGMGSAISVVDDTNAPTPSNQCLAGACANGVPGTVPVPAGAACNQGGLVCDGAGRCVGCNTGADCLSGACSGNVCVPATLLLFAGGPAGMLGSEWHAPGGAWSGTGMPGVTVDGVALAMTSDERGVALMRYTQLGDPQDNLAEFATWNSSSWVTPQPIGSGVTTQHAPSVAAAGTLAQVAFHGFDFNYYYAAYDGMTWSPTAEPTGTAGNAGPAIAALGTDAAVAYAKGIVNTLAADDRVGGAWLGEVTLAADPNIGLAPALVAMNGGPAELLLAYVSSSGRIRALTRSGGAWSMPVDVPLSTSNDPVALAALPGGGALLAFRGMDGLVYTATYLAGAWGNPQPLQTPNVSTIASPSVAHGIGGDTAELAFVGTDGYAYHSRLVAGSWSAPVAVGGPNLEHVAIAAWP